MQQNQPGSKKAAIFDLDGVIVDTARHHFAAWRQTAAELGFSLNDSDEELLKGVGRLEALAIVLSIGNVSVDEITAARLAAQKNDRYRAAIATIDSDDLLPGAARILRDLRGRGVLTALGSASANARTILERLGITELFDAVVDGTTVTKAKPDPEVFLHAARLLGVDPRDCVVFEDASAGIAAAQAAGMTAVGIGRPADLEAADTILPNLDEYDVLAERGITFGPSQKSLSVRLDAAPFHLDRPAQQWVLETLDSLTLEEKVGQLFCLLAMPHTQAKFDSDFSVAEPGGYMRRPSSTAELVEVNRNLQARAKVPLLIAANLEAGPSGAAFDRPALGSPLQAAATNNPESAYRIGTACAVEGGAFGVNWAFSPIVDIQTNPANPIVLNRGFGSDPERVATFGAAMVKGLQDHHVAASVKHWPGDGVDDRDQHLVTTVNSLSTQDWDASFGQVYKTMIDAGALTVMAAHIALPAYSRLLRPGIPDEEILPASLAPEITTDLLRGRLGFNGLVITDATLMGGMQMSMPRADAVPKAIAAGCDMFLFADDYATDYAHMMAGVRDGVISQRRLDEAVTRVLALKAALNLHNSPRADLTPGLESVNATPHSQWAAEQAAAGITLVKNKEAGLLPLHPDRQRRILVYSLRGGPMPTTRPAENFCAELERRGFQATLHQDPPPKETLFGAVGRDGAVTGAALLGNFDVVIYLADVPPSSNYPTARLEWTYWTAANLPRYIHQVPTIVVSLANPYHLQDVPRVKTYINAYASDPNTITALIDKLTGSQAFTGINPVDPFAGYWDARL